MLTHRLEKILSVLPQSNTLCDVGCDHGYVGIEALQRGISRQVIFSDISLPSLQKAQKNCPEALKTHAQFVCRDGLGNIQCDTAVIAGMGGLEIIAVLSGAKSLPNTLVLQPMRNQTDVRKWLMSHYEIVHDEKFFDGKYYDLIVARLGSGESLTYDQIKFGKTNLIHPSKDFVTFINKEIEKYKKILQACNDAEVQQTYAELCRISELIVLEDQK